MTDKQENFDIEMGPGAVMVVGPRGRCSISMRDNKVVAMRLINCDWITADKMTEAHRTLVDEVWSGRNEDGKSLDD